MKTKFQNLLKITLCLAILSSCSDDDEPTKSSLEGVWKLTSLVIESSFDFNGDGTATRDLFNETSCYEGDFIDFKDGGMIQVVNGLTFISVDDNSQPTHECLQGFDQTTTWTKLEDNTFTIKNNLLDITGSVSGNTATTTIVDGFQLEKFNGTDVVSDKETMTLTYVKQ